MHHRHDAVEGEVPLQELLHRHLVGGVEHGGKGLAPTTCLEAELESRITRRVWHFELETGKAGEVNRRGIALEPLGVAEDDGDWNTHVGNAQLRLG